MSIPEKFDQFSSKETELFMCNILQTYLHATFSYFQKRKLILRVSFEELEDI